MMDANESMRAHKPLAHLIADAGASDVVIDTADDILKEFISEVCPHIPLLKTAFAIARAIDVVRDEQLQKKLFRFFSGVAALDEGTRRRVLDAIRDDNDKRELIDQVLITLDRYVQQQKSEALFKLFLARVVDEISEQRFQDFSFVLETMNIGNLPVLVAFYAGERVSSENYDVLRGLIALRLVSVDYKGLPATGQQWPLGGSGEERFLPTDFGKQFVELLTRSALDLRSCS